MKRLSVVFIFLISLFLLNIPTEAAGNSQLIIINKKTNTLAFYNQGKLAKTFSVATGKSRDLTPEGKFRIVTKIKNRPYYKLKIPGGDPRNPLGNRWLGLEAKGTYGDTYAIHGNNNESSIGKYVSHGCVRMHNTEVHWLFDQVQLYTPVIITYSSSSFDAIAKANGFNFSSTNGWVKSNGKWYYYVNGTAKTGWMAQKGKWYYFDNAGSMQTGWFSYKNQWYYLDKNGAMKTGWLEYSGKWYYLNKSGVMEKGWLSYKNQWYYLDKSGAMKTGWLGYEGKWYYLNKSGVIEKGWLSNGGQWYFLDNSGVMKIGWLSEGSKRYYLKPSGEMSTGWVSVKDKWYYFDKSGMMQTGWLNLSGMKYFLSKDGAMVTGWFENEGKWYYFNRDGVMAADTVIEGYKLGEDGAWIQVDYVALGDSLAAGMTPQGQERIPVNGVDLDWGYPNYIAQDFAKSYQLLNFVNYGVSGYKTDDVIADLEKEAVQQEIKKATHITIDIGANDLLPVVQTNPSQAPAEIAAVAGKTNTILGKIDQLNPHVKVYVMGYYNPFPYITDAQRKMQLDQLLQAFNGQIQSQAVQHGDTFVPTAQVINVENFADYIPNPQNIHLSLLGYQVVAEEFWKAME